MKELYFKQLMKSIGDYIFDYELIQIINNIHLCLFQTQITELQYFKELIGSTKAPHIYKGTQAQTRSKPL